MVGRFVWAAGSVVAVFCATYIEFGVEGLRFEQHCRSVYGVPGYETGSSVVSSMAFHRLTLQSLLVLIRRSYPCLDVHVEGWAHIVAAYETYDLVVLRPGLPMIMQRGDLLFDHTDFLSQDNLRHIGVLCEANCLLLVDSQTKHFAFERRREAD